MRGVGVQGQQGRAGGAAGVAVAQRRGDLLDQLLQAAQHRQGQALGPVEGVEQQLAADLLRTERAAGLGEVLGQGHGVVSWWPAQLVAGSTACGE